MATKDPRTTPCDASRRAGRLAKARQFIDAADTVATLDDDNRFNDVLIKMKTRSGYSSLASTQNERTRAHRAAESLMSAAAEQ